MNIEFSGEIFKNTPVSNFMEICEVGVKLFHADGQTDKHELTSFRTHLKIVIGVKRRTICEADFIPSKVTSADICAGILREPRRSHPQILQASEAANAEKRTAALPAQ
jgi:hypothetical protein